MDHQQHTHTEHRISKMKLTSSASDQNVFFTYVCLINEVKPSLSGSDDGRKPVDRGRTIATIDANTNDVVHDQPIQVERSKALHELVESHKDDNEIITEDENVLIKDQPSDIEYEDESLSENEENTFVNPRKLKLTKMKWLTEDRKDSPDSSSPSISPTNSTTSTCSRESDENITRRFSFGDKCLSTILRLDREHKMFGLSNIAIVGTKTSKRMRKEDERPVFPQTAIIQVCCGGGCCKHKSNTDLPASLKCGGCRSCCVDPYCSLCVGPCGPPCDDPPCPSQCSQCPRGKCSCKSPCPPSKCRIDCTTCYGMKISFKRKLKPEPAVYELTPRSSCILQKPMAARSCHHLPHCLPPSSCFPYLMPCYWPARAGAPCNNPSRCFHNPPCRAPRIRRGFKPPEEQCPKIGKCTDGKDTKCPNQTCPGNNPNMKSAIESRFGKK